MKVLITGRHIKVADETKEYIHSKLDAIDRYFDRIKHVEVILGHNKNLYYIEILVSVVRGEKLVAKTVHHNYLTALDILMRKMERQLTKFKEKIKGKKERKSMGSGYF